MPKLRLSVLCLIISIVLLGCPRGQSPWFRSGETGMPEKETAISRCFFSYDENQKVIFQITGEPKFGLEFKDIQGSTAGSAVSKSRFVYGDKLEAYRPGETEPFYVRNMTDFCPWKVQAADVDGDGVCEISIGVYKTSRFHPVMAKRPFIYNWDGSDISPKWLGSRLSRPFSDYIFTDIDKDGADELIAAEYDRAGNMVITSYDWNGFGFDRKSESKPFKEVILSSRFDIESDGVQEVLAVVNSGNGFKAAVFRHEDDIMKLIYTIR
jgi:hypothetical protein